MRESRLDDKPFAIALSFPGEYRRFVKSVATHLAKVFGRERIFYDDWHLKLIRGANADLKLKNIYRSDSALIIPFFSMYYEKMWCRIEWDVIRSVLALRRRDDAVIPVHMDCTSIDGWEIVDLGIDKRKKRMSAKVVANEILDSYEHRFGTVSRHRIVPISTRKADRDIQPGDHEKSFGESLDLVVRYSIDVFVSLEGAGCRKRIAAAIRISPNICGEALKAAFRKCLDMSRSSEDKATEWWLRIMEEFDIIETDSETSPDDAVRVRDLADIIAMLGIPRSSMMSMMRQLDAGEIVENGMIASHVAAELAAAFADRRPPRFLASKVHGIQGDGLLTLFDFSSCNDNVGNRVCDFLENLADVFSIQLVWDDEQVDIELRIRKAAKDLSRHRAVKIFSDRRRSGSIADGGDGENIRYYCVIDPPSLTSAYQQLRELLNIVNSEISMITFFLLKVNSGVNRTEQYMLQRFTNRFNEKDSNRRHHG